MVAPFEANHKQFVVNFLKPDCMFSTFGELQQTHQTITRHQPPTFSFLFGNVIIEWEKHSKILSNKPQVCSAEETGTP